MSVHVKNTTQEDSDEVMEKLFAAGEEFGGYDFYLFIK